MDDALRDAVALFNGGRFTEFQDALEKVAGTTRAPSERQFYTSLSRLAEALHQLSVGDLEDAEALLGPALRKLDEFVPRFRGLNTEAVREDFRRVVTELREVRAGRKAEMEVARLPRLRFLPE